MGDRVRHNCGFCVAHTLHDAYRYIQGHVRHLHFGAPVDNEFVKDADNQRTFELLAPAGFTGFFSVEVINPDDPEAVLTHHINKYNQFMQAVR